MQSHLILNLAIVKKEDTLTRRNTLLKQAKTYIDNHLNPAKVNATDPTKGNFTQPLSVQEVLDQLEISKGDYYRALFISKDEHLELHLKRQPNYCFVNNVGKYQQIWEYNLSSMSIRQ